MNKSNSKLQSVLVELLPPASGLLYHHPRQINLLCHWLEMIEQSLKVSKCHPVDMPLLFASLESLLIALFLCFTVSVCPLT
ncbi:MAG: hypothetical protein AB2693_03840 [Candidatus Thiodiazotropha sp.]